MPSCTPDALQNGKTGHCLTLQAVVIASELSHSSFLKLL